MSDLRVKCNRCDTSEADLRRCTGCYTVFYCSRDCQRLDWTSHKKHCTRQSANQSSDDNKNTSKTTNANSATTQATTVNSNQIVCDCRVKCNRCDTSEADLRRCTGCYTVYYCSRDCQRLDWTSHKKHCTRQSANQSSDDNRNTSKTTNANSATTQTTTVSSNQIPNIPEKDSSEAQRDVEGARGSSGVDSDVNQTENAAKPGSKHTAFPFKEEKGSCIKCNKRYCTMLCGNCKATFYCSKKCQRSDWPEHKKHCKKVRDGGIPQKNSPLTDDEAFIIDNMKRRQQRFNEGMFERDEAKRFQINVKLSGTRKRKRYPLERLPASAMYSAMECLMPLRVDGPRVSIDQALRL